MVSINRRNRVERRVSWHLLVSLGRVQRSPISSLSCNSLVNANFLWFLTPVLTLAMHAGGHMQGPSPPPPKIFFSIKLMSSMAYFQPHPGLGLCFSGRVFSHGEECL